MDTGKVPQEYLYGNRPSYVYSSQVCKVDNNSLHASCGFCVMECSWVIGIISNWTLNLYTDLRTAETDICTLSIKISLVSHRNDDVRAYSLSNLYRDL